MGKAKEEALKIPSKKRCLWKRNWTMDGEVLPHYKKKVHLKQSFANVWFCKGSKSQNFSENLTEAINSPQ